MNRGELVLDDVAISGTRAWVRTAQARARRPRITGWPTAAGRCAQGSGGAVAMSGGTVTFKGASSITGTTAVRFAKRTRMYAQTRTHTRTHACACSHTRTRARACIYLHTRTHARALTLTYTHTRARTLGRAPIAAAAARVQAYLGGAVYVLTGELVFNGVAISGTRADVRLLARGGCVAGGGPRQPGGVRRAAAAQWPCPVGPSRSKGAARSRAP